MKIGILSVNMHTKGLNFACPVHSYAFQQFLLANGIACEIIDYKANYYDNFEPRYPSEYYAEKYENLLRRTDVPESEKAEYEQKLQQMKGKLDGYTALYKERQIRYDKFQNFIEKYYIKSAREYDSDLFEVVDPGYDCYICATDVVWKSNPKLGFDRGYFLASSCMDNKWKISYSASRGVPKTYTPEEQELFFHYISDIDYISVRETSLKEFIEANSDLKAKVVLDPVLFHDKDFYSRITVRPPEEHYVLFYYAEERTRNSMELAVQCAKQFHLKIVELTNLPIKDGVLSEYNDVDSIFRYDVGPDEWLGYIQYADFVVTNSFHATCFSIIFEKKFFVGSRHGDKIKHLLSNLGLDGRIISPSGTVDVPLDSGIDYGPVRRTLAEGIRDSADFLLNAIHACENGTRAPRDYDTYRKSLTYRIVYNSGKGKHLRHTASEADGRVLTLRDGRLEFTPAQEPQKNDGTSCLLPNVFRRDDVVFNGWKLRIRIDNTWFWYLKSGRLVPRKAYSRKKHGAVRLFQPGEAIPYIPINHFSAVIADASWKEPVHAQASDGLYQWMSSHLNSRTKRFIKRTLRKISDS